MNAMKEDLSAKEVKENLSVKKEASVVAMTIKNMAKEISINRNHAIAIKRVSAKKVKEISITRNPVIPIKKEVKEATKSLSEIKNLSETANLTANVSTVTKNAHVAAAADTAARKTLNSTAHAQQAKSASTNISPTPAYAHAAKPTTSSSLALSQ